MQVIYSEIFEKTVVYTTNCSGTDTKNNNNNLVEQIIHKMEFFF